MDIAIPEIIEVEKVLHSAGILPEGKTLAQKLEEPGPNVQRWLNRHLRLLGVTDRTLFNVEDPRFLFRLMYLYMFSEGFYLLRESNHSEVVKRNASQMHRYVSKQVITSLSPYIVHFLKWDLNRRNWKHYYDEYRVDYLEKIVKQIDEEIRGQESNMLAKYISLLLDFVIDKIDEYHDQMIEYAIKYPFAFSFVPLLRNKLDRFRRENGLSALIEKDTEDSFRQKYSPLAKQYIEGLIQPHQRFDSLFLAFIEAQNDYKKLVSSILHSLKSKSFPIGNLVSNLQKVNIPNFIQQLKAIYASVPGILVRSGNESYYHVIFHVIMKLVGCEINSEVITNKGRIDVIIQISDLLYIIEFKLSDSQSAISQIKERKYYERYSDQAKRLILLGLSFDTTDRNIRNEYHLEEISSSS